MTCDVLGGYVQEYIKGCDVSQWGEGCEMCVRSSGLLWGVTLLIIAVCVGVITLAVAIIYKKAKKLELNSQNKSMEVKK